MKKTCPKCGKEYYELDNYCTKCGIELIAQPNRCSARKSVLCAHKTFEDDDIYCSCCGALTTYALERNKEHI